ERNTQSLSPRSRRSSGGRLCTVSCRGRASYSSSSSAARTVMGLPPFTTDDDRINDAYMHAIYPIQLVLMLFIVAFRTRNITEAKASSKHRVKPVPFCYRVPHLVCCLALVAMYITIIFYDAVLEGQDMPWSTATTKAYYLAMDVRATLMWALCAGLVLTEQRHQKHTCRLLRLWWILNLVVASAFVGFELVELVPLPESKWGQGPGRWTLVRACGFIPAFFLGMIGCFEADTPPTSTAGPPAYLSSSTPSNYAAPLLLGSTQGGATMPAEEPAVPLSAEAHASFFSQLTFSYMSELLALGRGRALEHSDLFGLDDQDASAANEKLFVEALAKGGSFLRCWHRAYGVYFWVTGALQLLNTACTFANPLFLHAIVTYINKPDASGYTNSTAILLAVGIFAANCFKSIVLGQYFWRGFRLGLRTRAAVGQVVYRKALALAHEQRQEFGTGAIVSYMQIDAQKLADALPYLHLLWQGPLQLAVATYMLYDFMGYSGLAALGVLIISMPLNTWISNKARVYTKLTMEKRDKRVKYANELLQGVKILKLFAWEPAMLGQLEEKRRHELKAVRLNMLIGGVMGFIFTALPLVVTAASFGLFPVHGMGKITPENPDGKLTAAIAFTALSLFQVLRFPLLVVPMMISSLMDLMVVNGRLTKFFRAPERPIQPLLAPAIASTLRPLRFDDGLYYDQTPAAAGTPAIEMHAATFKWPEPKEDDKKKKKGPGGGGGPPGGPPAHAPPAGVGSAGAGASSSTAPTTGENAPKLRPTLVDLSFTLPQGGLVGIGGPVGSGKSTLLSALVGDVPRLQGRCVVRGSIALCTQEPWIQNKTLRDNILFGLPYDDTFYNQVLSACALRADLEQLAAGDATEIGERGVNLSGGQKARVALARACYARASVVLLDDVLSAVDAEVGAHLVAQCITGLLRQRGALVVFVTHHLHWLHECDHVLMLDEAGKVKAQGPPASIGSLPRANSSGKLSRDSSVGSGLDAQGEGENGANGANGSGGEATKSKPVADKAKPAGAGDKDKAKGKQMSEEDRERGTVSRSVWLLYARALGTWNVSVGLFGAAVVSQALVFGSSFWLGVWAGDLAPNTTTVIINGTKHVETISKGSPFHEISGGQPWFYLAVYVAAALVSALCILLRSVLLAYASVSAGRRIHDDAVRAVFASPASFFDVTPLGRIINRFSGDVQKVDTALASSLSQFVSYSVSLVCTLAIIVVNSLFILLSLPPLGIAYLYTSSYYRNSAREVQRLESISKSPIYASFQEALNGASSIHAYAANSRFEESNRKNNDYNLRANYISLAANRWLTVRLELYSNILLFLTALLAVLEAMQTASLDESDPQVRTAAALRASAAGLALTYAPGLTDTLNFLIRQLTLLETQMIGIVGRTGAGKSSILVCLYRLAELRSGAIIIDGLDLARVPLPTLRARLAIIPQDPVLFTGTLRSNLDPTDLCTDEELWAAMRQAGMEAPMKQHPDGLKRPIEERGGNLSMGQRQLLCLCRALLRKARVLVLDEATASVDMESDALIQQTLQHNMSGTTVLTIAHRLETIMHCDRVVVMHEGRVAEAGPPQELRTTPGSKFAELWEART
ncbi:multidrug resistance-associated protein 3, partial [Chrysochromulina tobinii]